MDDSFNLARHVARFVTLLIRQPDAVDLQKLELRTLVLLTRETTLRLSTRDGQLMANGLSVPQVLAGVRELSDRMVGHGIDSIEIGQGMAPAELLALGRVLAEPPADDLEPVRKRLRKLDQKTITITLHEAAAPVEAAVPEEAEPAAGTPERIPFLLDRANRLGYGAGIANAFEEVAFTAEQATREGRTATAVDVMLALIAHERNATDPEVRRMFVLAVRRLTKPAVLHPITRMLVERPERRAEAITILARCGNDGADAVVDHILRAASRGEQEVYRAALGEIPAADDALVAMLHDTRPHVARIAAELIAERRPPDGDKALAELLTVGDTRVRRAAVRALGAYETSFAVDAIGRALEDAITEVRLEAVAALGARRVQKAADAIGRAIPNEHDAEVQLAMLASLGKIGTNDAIAKLVKAAEPGSGLFGSRKDAGVRIAAVRALADAKSPAAQTALKALAADKDREVRELATRIKAR